LFSLVTWYHSYKWMANCYMRLRSLFEQTLVTAPRRLHTLFVLTVSGADYAQSVTLAPRIFRVNLRNHLDLLLIGIQLLTGQVH
jgi:hypothetical protein